jgi:hypothetical protein
MSPWEADLTLREEMGKIIFYQNLGPLRRWNKIQETMKDIDFAKGQGLCTVRPPA